MADREVDPQRGNMFVGSLSVTILVDGNFFGVIPAEDIIECWFVEDIYSFCMTGKLKFYDTIRLLERGPFLGNEKVVFTYGVEDRRSVTFEIWDTPEIVQASANRSTDKSLIECNLVDSTYKFMFYANTSTSFPKSTILTDIVHDILVNMIGWSSTKLNIDACAEFYNEPIAFPWWSPAKMITWLLERSNSQKMGTGGYLCYNNTFNTNSVNVYPLNWLLSDYNKVDDQDYIFAGKNDITQNKILDWSISGVDQSMLSTVRGGQFKGLDQDAKKLLNYHYTFKEGIESTIILGKKALLPDISDDYSAQEILGGSELELKTRIYNRWVKDYCIQFLADFILQGNERRYAGMQIQVQWPSVDPERERFQKQLEGLYLIKSITHSFTGHGNNMNYIQRMRLIKNGFQNSSSNTLLNATKTKVSYKSGTGSNVVLIAD